jgi:hypothetical protein
MTAESGHGDRRGEGRSRTANFGKITFREFRFVFDCVITERSSTGARVRCSHAYEVPTEFHLFDWKDQLLYPARLAWRKGDRLGVEFTGPGVDVRTSADRRHDRFRFV